VCYPAQAAPVRPSVSRAPENGQHGLKGGYGNGLALPAGTGAGGMGEVYRGSDTRLNRDVAPPDPINPYRPTAYFEMIGEYKMHL